MKVMKDLTWRDALMYLPYKNQEQLLDETALATTAARPWYPERSKQGERLNCKP